MHIDSLTIIETIERAVEFTESKLRRHARTILITLGILAVVVATAFWPWLADRMHGPPAARAEPRGRPSAAPSRAPSPRVATAAARPSPSASATAAPTVIFVHVTGAVAHPGVIRLPSGARAFQAVTAAGGALADADLNRINLARRLQDESMLVIPSQGDAPSAGAAAAPESGGRSEEAAPAASASGAPDEDAAPPGSGGKATLEQLERRPIPLDTADAAQLQTVPGIGPGLAGAIVRWRREHGPFKRLEDLRKVPRFGEKLYARTHRCFRLPAGAPAGTRKLPDE